MQLFLVLPDTWTDPGFDRSGSWHAKCGMWYNIFPWKVERGGGVFWEIK